MCKRDSKYASPKEIEGRREIWEKLEKIGILSPTHTSYEINAYEVPSS
jgi:hypothetical protein